MPRRESNALEISEEILKIFHDKDLLLSELDHSDLDHVHEGIASLLVHKGFPESEVRNKQVTITISFSDCCCLPVLLPGKAESNQLA